MQMKRLILTGAISAVMGLAGCSEPSGPISEPEVTQQSVEVENRDVEVRLQKIFERIYAEDMAALPSSASYRGIKDRHGEWNPMDEAFVDSRRAIKETRLAEVADIDPATLSEDMALSLKLYKLGLERDLARDEFRHQNYIIHQHRGPHTGVASFLINIHSIKDVADAEAYISRIKNVSSYFDDVIGQLNLRAEDGMFLVDWMYPKMIKASTNIITGAPFDGSGEDSAIWADFQDKVAALEIETAQKDALLADAKKAMVEQMQPAYQRLIKTLSTQSETAATDDGVWRLPDGDAYYKSLLEWYTTTDLSADQVHQLGLDNVARIQGEMRAVMARVEFDGELQDFFSFVRHNQDLRYSNDDEGRAAYLIDADAAVKAMWAKLPEYFGIVPKAELLVKRVEEFRERSAGKAFYQGPPSDGSRPGIFYANLYDMNSMPKTDLEALVFHEGVPGHHLQRAVSAELDSVPDFQRYLSFTAYSEGWGLYSEYLAKEMGFYQDPYSEFGRLAMELWRAARLVVDTGIHAKRWTREEAIDYLVQNTPNAEADCVKAIERYIAQPGQATAYMIGKIRILELREKAKAALGDQFDIREFHNVVLGSGPIPLDVLTEKVDAMIAVKADI